MLNKASAKPSLDKNCTPQEVIMPAKRKSSSSSKGRAKVHKVMKEHKQGKLKSGSGKKVKSRKQAIAIGLSEARRAGAKVPTKKGGGRKKKSSKKK